VNVWLGASLAPAAPILLIIGAGGGFKPLLIDSGIGDTLAPVANNLSVNLLLLAWIAAVLLRLATGSATVPTGHRGRDSRPDRRQQSRRQPLARQRRRFLARQGVLRDECR
jgi:hypothetical protein